MAGIDHSIYFQQKGIDFGQIGEGLERGARLSEMAKQGKLRDEMAEREKRQYHQQEAAPLIMSMNKDNYAQIYGQLKKMGNPAADDLSPEYDEKLVYNYQQAAKPVAMQLEEKKYNEEMALKGYQKSADGKWVPVQGGMADMAKQKAAIELAGAKTDQEYKRQQTANLKTEGQKTLAEIAKLNKATVGGAGKTEGTVALDKDFAKDYNDWTSGGANTAQTEINKLKSVADSLKNREVTTGGMTGLLGDRLTSNNVLKARADVQSTVMNSLKAILGAQFTEKEGDRIIKNTWNEADSTENNLARINRLVGDLEAQARAKGAKGEYFQKYGTLSGFGTNNQNVASAAPQPAAEKVWQGVRYVQRDGNWVPVGAVGVAKK